MALGLYVGGLGAHKGFLAGFNARNFKVFLGYPVIPSLVGLVGYPLA